MNYFSLKAALLMLCLVSLSGCLRPAQSTRNETSASNTPQTEKSVESKAKNEPEVKNTASKPGEIRKIDFKNFTYEPYCAGEETEKITVKNGEFSEEKGEFDRLYFNVFDVSYGDVNGDQDEDAIVLTVCNTGGSGNFSEGFVYVLKNGKPALLTRIEGGDRAYGGLREAKVENGLLSVDRNDAGEEGAACCAEFAVTTKYKWNGSKLVETGKSSRRELYPATKVSFERGMTFTNLNVEIPSGELKRFSVNARAGQVLTVSADTNDFSVSLLSNDADIQDNEREIVAKLKKNGDYVIQIQNISEKDAKGKVKIEIK